MKNLTFFIAMLFSISLMAQDFPGNKPKVLLGKKLKVKDNSSYKNNGYNDFYLDKEFNKKYACCQKANSKYEELAGKTFKVEEVTMLEDKISCLTLKNGSQTVYFKYDGAYEARYPFEVIGGLKLEESANIDRIHEVTNTDGQGTTFISEPIEGIAFVKANYGNESYGINISMVQNKLLENPKGVSLLLENSIVLKKPEANVKVISNNDGTYTYITAIVFKSEETALLKINKITGIEQAGFKKEIKDGTALKGIFRNLTPLTPKKSNLTNDPTAYRKDPCNLIAANSNNNGSRYIASNSTQNLMISKTATVKEKSEMYEVIISVKTNKPTEKLRTAAILFDNGKEIRRTDAIIEVYPKNEIYKYSARFYLSHDEVGLFKNNIATEIMVYSYKEKIEDGDFFKEKLNCPVMLSKEGYRLIVEDSKTRKDRCIYIKETKSTEGKDIFYTEETDGITLCKFPDPSVSSVAYTADLKVIADKADAEATGATIFLENGKSIARLDKKLKTEESKGKKYYYVIFELTEAEVTLLKNNCITSIKLGDVSRKVNTGTFINDSFNCLIEKNANENPVATPAVQSMQPCDLMEESHEKDYDMYAIQDKTGGGLSVFKIKDRNKNTEEYVANIRVRTKEYSKDILLAMITFKESEPISRDNAEIKITKLGNGTYEYNARFTLTDNDVAQLKSNHAYSVMLDTFNDDIDSDSLKEKMNCLTLK